MNPAALLLPSIALIALSGCAAPAMRYPSLLPRPVEAQPLAIPQAAVAAVVITADPALDAQVAALESALAQTEGMFPAAAERAKAASAAAKRASVGSEEWLSAQSAIAALESLRSQSLAALTDLDRLAIDRGTAGLPPYPAIAAARARAEALVDAHQAAIDAVQR